MIKRLSAFSLKYGLIPLACHFIRFYLGLMRYTVIGEETFMEYLRSDGKAIISIWHQRIFGAINYAKRFRVYEPSVMISQSRDGEMIAQVFSRIQFRPVRGSSSRGGRAALHAMAADLAEHPLAVHVVDGPRGPRGVVKEGLIALAQRSGVPIFPVSISFSRAWVIKSWDLFLIPKPFSTILVRWGEPIYIPADLDKETFEFLRVKVETQMRESQCKDDCAWGWEPFF